MITADTQIIDVSTLPPHVEDHRSPIWWANVLLLCIETTMFGLIVATYFYLRMNFTQWPPVRSDVGLYATNPDLGFATANMIVLLISVVPMALVDFACRRHNDGAVRIGMTVMVLLGLLTIALRFYEFSGVKFRWDENAYAAIVWTTLGMHLLHLITGTAENFIMTLWSWLKPLDSKHVRDIRVGAVYWYWIVGIWIPLYAIIYFGPRIL
jgi:cytochrome c oxidase subunit III